MRLRAFLLMAAFVLPPAAAAQSPARVTVIYDAFGKPSTLKRGWGYSALVEYGGQRILFDTGGHGEDFARNVKTLGIDLTTLDFVVISHRHGDHTSGLGHVLRVNPKVPIYTPADLATFGGGGGIPGGPLGKLIERKVDSTPEEMRYFAGPPETQPSKSEGWPTPWPGANITAVTTTLEPVPGFYLFSTTSENAGTREMNELSMAIRTPEGLVLVVGCSHPGIEKILNALVKIDTSIHTVFGGFHLVDVTDADVTRLAESFRDRWKIRRLSAGHCTGQFAFSEFLRVYGDKYDRAGVGAVVQLPSPVTPAAVEIDMQVWSPMMTASDRFDADAFLAVLSPDLVRVSVDRNEVYDLERYRREIVPGFARARERGVRRRSEARFISRAHEGALARDAGIFRSEVVLPDGQTRVTYTEFAMILRREAGGWRILVDQDTSRGGTITEADFLRGVPPSSR